MISKYKDSDKDGGRENGSCRTGGTDQGFVKSCFGLFLNKYV